MQIFSDFFRFLNGCCIYTLVTNPASATLGKGKPQEIEKNWCKLKARQRSRDLLMF